MKYLKYFEKIIIGFSIVILLIIIVLQASGVANELYQLFKDPQLLFSYEEGLKLFSLLMNIFIALELVETLKDYMTKGYIQIQFILIIGLIAVSRKLITTDFSEADGFKNIGMGVIIISLAGAYYLISKSNADKKDTPSH